MLKIDQTLENSLQKTPTLDNIIGSNKIEFNKLKRKNFTIAKGN